jgi:hypothetical protein
MKIELGKIDGDIIIFSILIPVLTAIVWYNYSYQAAIAMLLFFGGMYSYFNLFLYTALSLKNKSTEGFSVKIISYAALSIVILAISYSTYGYIFSLKVLFVAVVLFIVQSFFIFSKASR